jgi:acetyl-CoA carboxylase alpha subunit
MADLRREFWPRVLLPRRANRASFLDYVDRQETRRLEMDNDQLVESQQTVIAPPAPAPGQRSPIVTRQVSASRRELRRSRRTGKRPERYGQ